MNLRLVLLLVIALFARSVTNACAATRDPFLAVYLNFHELFDRKAGVDEQSRAIAAALDRMKACGFNAVLPYATTTSGEATYPSALIPKRMYGGSDPLAVLIREAKVRGLRVYPVQCALPSGGEKPNGILLQHPEWALRNAAGKPLGTISPANPQAREWVASVSREIVAKYQPDGLLLDYLRFPNQPVQLDPVTSASVPSPSRSASAEEKARFQAYREDALTEQARLISAAARSAKRDIRIAIYSWGPHVVKKHYVSQNWPLWAQRGYIDSVNLSGYCFPESYGDKFLKVFEQRLADAQNLGAPVELTFALGIKTSHGEIKHAADVKPYIDIAKKLGVGGTGVFTWGHLRPFLDDFEKGNYLREFAK